MLENVSLLVYTICLAVELGAAQGDHARSMRQDARADPENRMQHKQISPRRTRVDLGQLLVSPSFDNLITRALTTRHAALNSFVAGDAADNRPQRPVAPIFSEAALRLSQFVS